MTGTNLSPDYDLAKRLRNLETAVRQLATRDPLAMSALGVQGSDVHIAGNLYTTVGRATPVTSSGSVAAYLNADGRVGATASSIRFKQDVEPADVADLVSALYRLGLVRYRYTAEVDELGDDAPLVLGTIAEYAARTALAEYVVPDEDGAPFTVNWERMGPVFAAALQDANRRIAALEAAGTTTPTQENP